MSDLSSILPIIIPIAILELALTVAALIHIFTHKTYQTGNRVLWVLLSFVSIIGPVLYFVIGKGEK